MDCFTNLIGIRGECGTPTTPDSNLYIQDLSSISIKNADKAIHEEHESGFSLLSDKIDFATKYTEQTIRSFIQNKFTLRSSLESGTIGKYKDNLQTLAADAGYLRGIQVKVTKNPFYELFINQVSIHGQTTQSENIVVWDLVENKLLDTIAISAVAGERITKDVYKSYPSNGQILNLFIGSDAAVYKSDVSKGCCGGSSYGSFSGKKILSASNKVNENLEGGTGSSGISLSYSINCSFEPLLCKLKSLLAMPVLYRAGYEIIKEMRYSQRLNSVVTIYGDEYDELMEMYNEEYKKQMTEVMENVDVSNMCFKCRKKSRPETALP